ncbi:MAG: hypothetical protein HEEMFOPI_00435 [Holosporales bacterium]
MSFYEKLNNSIYKGIKKLKKAMVTSFLFSISLLYASQEMEMSPRHPDVDELLKENPITSPATSSPGLSKSIVQSTVQSTAQSTAQSTTTQDLPSFPFFMACPVASSGNQDFTNASPQDLSLVEHVRRIHDRLDGLEKRSSVSLSTSQLPQEPLHQSILETLEERFKELSEKIDSASRPKKGSVYHNPSDRPQLGSPHPSDGFDHLDLYSENGDQPLPHATHSSLEVNSPMTNPSWLPHELSPENLEKIKYEETMLSPITSVRILVLDGGGIRGILQLYFLALLEEETQKHTTELFHMIGGTSVGGQIAALLNIKDDTTGKAKYSARFLLNFYLKHYPNVFKKKWHTLWGLIGEKYKTGPFKRLLRTLAGDKLYQDGVIPSFATAYDLTSDSKNKLKIFFSKDEDGLSVQDVILSTTAAPGYFKSHKAANGHEYIDGGIIANYPSLVGVNLAYKHFSNFSKIVLVSLGTGTFPDSTETYSSLRHVPLWNIARKIPHFFLRGQQALAEEGLQYRPDVVRFKFNPEIKGDSIPLDQASPSIIARLKEAALHSWIQNREKIDNLKKLFPLGIERENETL